MLNADLIFRRVPRQRNRGVVHEPIPVAVRKWNCPGFFGKGSSSEACEKSEGQDGWLWAHLFPPITDVPAREYGIWARTSNAHRLREASGLRISDASIIVA